MSNRKVGVIVSAAVLLAGAFAASNNVSSSRVSHSPSAHQNSMPEDNTVPDHVIYDALFERVVSVKKKIRELQNQRRIPQKPTFALQKEAQFNETQAGALEEIALACKEEVMRQDEKARAIIFEYRAQFPDGKIPKGVTPPPPPPELKIMWEERNAIILRARDRLRAALGEQTFHRFDQHVKFPYGADDENIKRRKESVKAVVGR